MVPKYPAMLKDHEEDAVSASDDSEADTESSSSEPVEEVLDGDAELEQEYHTEDSEDGSEIEEKDSDIEALAASGPLLPQELLNPSGHTNSLQLPIEIPWEQMTREQKVAQRNRNRKSKKRMWDRLRRDSKGTGVLEAGKFAQLKRGLVMAKDKVKNGRVTKKRKADVKVSGRQQLLENRKQAIEQSQSQLMRPSKRQKKTRSQQTGTG